MTQNLQLSCVVFFSLGDFIKLFSLEFFFLFQLILVFFFFTFLKEQKLLNNLVVVVAFGLLFFIFSLLWFLKKKTMYGLPPLGLVFLNGALKFSENVIYIKSVLFFCSSMVVFLGFSQLKKSKNCLHYLTFVGFSLFSITMLLNVNKVFESVVVLESVSFSLYFLLKSDSRQSRGGSEAVIKYFCLGAFSSGLLLLAAFTSFLIFPISLDFLSLREVIYFSHAGGARFLIFFFFFLFSFGVFFKLSVFPFHLWTPEVYDGVSGTTISFFTVVVKSAVFFFYYRFFFVVFEPMVESLVPFFYIVCGVSIAYGAYGASLQPRIHRLFGYSSINFMGFCMTAFFCNPIEAFAAVLINFIFYGFSTLLFFFYLLRIKTTNVFCTEIETLTELTGANRMTTATSVPLSFFFLSLNGVPPFPGFFTKLMILNSLAASGFFLLILFISLLNIVSYYYALRLFKSVFFLENPTKNNNFLLVEGAGLNYIVFLSSLVLMGLTLFHIFIFERVLKGSWALFVFA